METIIKLKLNEVDQGKFDASCETLKEIISSTITRSWVINEARSAVNSDKKKSAAKRKYGSYWPIFLILTASALIF